MLAFEKDVGSLLAQTSKYGEAIHLAKTAAMIRQDMLSHKSNSSSIFNKADVEQAVPQSLLQFVCMIEHGADIKSQLQHGASKSDLALSNFCSLTALLSTKKEQNTTGIPRNVRPLLLSMLVCLCLPKPERDN